MEVLIPSSTVDKIPRTLLKKLYKPKYSVIKYWLKTDLSIKLNMPMNIEERRIIVVFSFDFCILVNVFFEI